MSRPLARRGKSKTGRGEVAKLNWPRWAQALLIAAVVLLIGNRMTLVVETAAMRAGLAEE